jgi:Protein of unknown function (DUF2891)
MRTMNTTRVGLVLMCLFVAIDISAQSRKPAQSGSGSGSTTDRGELDALMKSLPDAKGSPLSEIQALGVAAMPLACIDHPQARSETPSYLYDTTTRLIDGYDKTRVFYGCSDWHSAANSTWAMVKILKTFPKTSVGPLIREKLGGHLGSPNVVGEMQFLRDAKSFERPYGYAWVLKIYGELSTWDDPKGKLWATNLAPLANFLTEKLVAYFKELPYPMRVGLHPNTAFCISLLMDYAEATKDVGFKAVLVDTAKRFFLSDTDCPASYEPSASDFLSPCLAEAELMTKILDQSEFPKWHDAFMPPVQSSRFKALLAPVAVGKDDEELTKTGLMGDKSHLIGLAFSRAQAMNRIADTLPAGDPRVGAYRRLAAIHGQRGFSALGDAGYTGSHWFGAYALLYALTERN